MKELIRFGVSVERALLERFDRLIGTQGYSNRSKAISDLMRAKLVERDWETGRNVVGVITLLFDHRQRDLSSRITHVQHDHHRVILSSQHIHLDHDNCLEVIIVKGKPSEVKSLASEIETSRGVKHVSVSMTSTGEGII